MRLLKGKEVAESVTADCAARVRALAKSGIAPALAVLRLGKREDDLSYERGIIRRFEQAKAKVFVHELPESAAQNELEELLKKLDRDPLIHGILLFRPLPPHINENSVKNLLSEIKDVDCMTDAALYHVFAQDGKGHLPCTPEAVMEIAKYYCLQLASKKVTIVGRSMVVGKPLAMLMLKANATVNICHTKTADLKAECLAADIIVAAAGSAKMIKGDYVKEGQIVLDVGINMTEDGLCGDVDFEAVSQKAEAVTPVPGGVGAVTTAILLRHVIESAENMLQA